MTPPRSSSRTLLGALTPGALVLGMLLAYAPPAQAQAVIVDRVVAVIEDEAIFLSDVERRARPFEHGTVTSTNPEVRTQQLGQLQRETLDRMIDEILIRRAATRNHINVDNDDIDHMVAGSARERGATPEQLYAALEAEGISRSEYRSFLEVELLRLRLLNFRLRGRVNITDVDIREAYHQELQQASMHMPFHIAHVFLAFPAHANETDMAAVRTRAEDVARRAQAGESFAALARELSEDPQTRENAGDLGEIDPTDEENPMPDWILTACASLQPGQSSPPVRGENGYHIFLLISRETPDFPPLEEVRDRIYNFLLDREMTRMQLAYLRELRRLSSLSIRW